MEVVTIRKKKRKKGIHIVANTEKKLKMCSVLSFFYKEIILMGPMRTLSQHPPVKIIMNVLDKQKLFECGLF